MTPPLLKSVFAARPHTGLMIAGAFFLTGLVVVFITRPVFAAGTAGMLNEESAGIPQAHRDFFNRYCMECHGPEKSKGDFRIDLLGHSKTAADAANWELVLDNLHLGEMPPGKHPLQPTAPEVEKITAWITEELQRAKRMLAGEGSEVVLRRLNRVEYANTITDIFGIEGDLTSTFPEDTLHHGFDNIGSSLMLSSAQLQEYLKAAEFIIDEAIATGAKPETKKVRYNLHDVNRLTRAGFDANLAMRHRKFERLSQYEKDKTRDMEAKQASNPNYGLEYPVWENGRLRFATLADGPGVDPVLYTSSYVNVSLGTQKFLPVKERGWYRVAIEAYPVANQGKPIRLQVQSGKFTPNAKPTIVETLYLADPKPATHEFRVLLLPGERVEFVFLDAPQNLRPEDRLKLKGPFIAVRNVEVEGPIIEQWPPKGHVAIFGDNDPTDLGPANVRRIITHLAPTLFRRPVSEDVIQRYSILFESLSAKLSPKEAFRATLSAMMIAPQFLYRVEQPKNLDRYDLASRLSYFLWRSTPDAELLRKAGAGLLEKPDTLRAEVDRMIADPKSERFVRDFAGAWLGLYKLGAMRPDKNLYPEYDAELEVAMRKETVGFIDEMFRRDLPLTALIDSDWTVLNERLAKHYGIDDVKGPEFRVVKLDKSNTVRGGLLTQASIHALTSDGTTTSPIIRGVWVLDNLLGTPPPPPPPDVPAIEPDIRGATNIRDQLAKHRSVVSCVSCHQQIDPPGLALENFDVIGGWRENYRALQTVVGKARPQITNGPPVDASGEIGGQSFATFPEFRQQLFEKKDLLFTNVAEKLTTFALGRRTDFADREDLQKVVLETTSRGAGLRTMVYTLIASPLFRQP